MKPHMMGSIVILGSIEAARWYVCRFADNYGRYVGVVHLHRLA
jgi:hypothetical protein